MHMVPVIHKIDPVALVKMAEPTDKKEDQQQMYDVFELADANKDCLLNADEFADYMKKWAAHEAKLYGDSANFSDGELKFRYDDFYNKFTPGVEGVSFDDLCGILDVFERMQEEMQQ